MTTTLASLENRTQTAPRTSPTLPELSMDGFASIVCGHSAFQLLWAGTQLKLFTTLEQEGTQTKEQLAKATGLEEQPLRILLHGLTALRLIHKDDELYSNGPIASRHLIDGAPDSWIPILGWQHYIVYKGLFDFVDSLKQNRNVGLGNFPGQGNTLYERLSSDPFTERVFQDAMSSLSSSANRELAASLDLSASKHLLDIGGGDGTNAMNLVRKNPGLKATIFDGATVLKNARRNIRQAGYQDKVSTHEGHCFKDPLPTNMDTILLAHMITIWSQEKNTKLIKKCYDALPAGGRLLIFNMVSHDDETGPLINALGSPYFQAIATGEGMLYCDKDIRAWLNKAGFKRIRRVGLPLEHALFEAIK